MQIIQSFATCTSPMMHLIWPAGGGLHYRRCVSGEYSCLGITVYSSVDQGGVGGISITDQITSNINLREGWVLGQRRHAKHEPDTSFKLNLV